MMKEKTVVCVGILLILAVLTSCALFYSVNDYSAVHDAPGVAYSGVSVMPAGTAASISGSTEAAQGAFSPAFLSAHSGG